MTISDREFIGSIYPQKCGDDIKIIDIYKNKEKRNRITYIGTFIKYPYQINRRLIDIQNGVIANPIKEEQEFINKIWKQKEGDLKILSRNVKKSGRSIYYDCQFIGSDKVLCIRKDQIKIGNVTNPQKEEDFFNKIYIQNCGDSLKILEKTNQKQGTNILYKCIFTKYPYEVIVSKAAILSGGVINPQIEQVEFIDKIWPQNCGDSLKIIKKSKQKQGNNYLFEVEFISNGYKKLVQKESVIKGTVNNPDFINLEKFPFKNEQYFYNYLKENFENIPLINEIAEKLNISLSYLYHSIQNYRDIESHIHFLSHTSFQEKELLKFVKSIYKEEILASSRKILKTREIDIYLPKLQIGFEFNGNYWHSELKKDKKYHLEKSLLAKKNNIRLIHIYEYEWIQNKLEIQNFIKDILNIEKTKIFARKCKVQEISTEIYQNFCNKNHLQGECGARVKLGLFYKNKLIQIMSFGLSRFNKNYEYELIRECSKYNYIIIGGVEKLWNFFLKNYNPQSIISYCDFNKFSGKSYEKLGFKLQKINLDFVWWDSVKNICYWRNPYNHQNMKSLIKIWRAGQMSYIWNK